MPADRPSPFTVPLPEHHLTPCPESDPPPPLLTMTVGHLIQNLEKFANYCERAAPDIGRVGAQIWAHQTRERQDRVFDMVCQFRGTEAMDRVRSHVLAEYGEELTVRTARRFLGDLIRRHRLSADAAEALSLGEAMDRLEPAADEPPAAPSLMEQAKQFLDEKDREQEAMRIAMRLMPYVIFGPEGPFARAKDTPTSRAAGAGDTASQTTGSPGGEGGPPPSVDGPKDWAGMGEAKRAILTVLRRTAGRLDGKEVAKDAGYTHGTLRHHFGELQRWNYIDRANDGYAITPTGAGLVPV